MWVFAFFDMPTDTPRHKKAYRQFREFLLADGYTMIQYSVYGRPCATFEAAEKHARRLEDRLPDEGEIRLIQMTSLQFSRMLVFSGKNAIKPEDEPEQLSFF